VLAELRIRDFAIIDELQLVFKPGFSVLTGETGAGKSIIVDAVELVLGGRADSTVVRAGAERAIVEATFRLDSVRQAVVGPVLEREELLGDSADVLLLGREVRLNGRSVSRVNGRAVTLTLLRQVAEGLVDIHGQSEHLSLLQVHKHVDLLDRYADLGPSRARVAELAAQVRAVRHELAGLLHSERELAHRADLLQFQIGEIEAAALQPDEEKAVLEERLRLTNAEQLADMIGEALHALEVGDGESLTALDMLGTALRALERLARIDPALEPQLRSAENINYQAEELVRNLRDYEEEVEHNPRRLREVEERLALIRQLQRKYGPTIADVLAYAEEAARELDAITHSEERIAELQEEEEQVLIKLGSLAVALSQQRRKAAQQLAVGIEEELSDLRMDGARFGVDFEWREDAVGVPLPQPVSSFRFQVSGSGVDQLESSDVDPEAHPKMGFDASGIDRIEFLVSPNPGEPLKPLARIASGGETSRLMLALKTVLSRADETPTLVFDEIDQGIGGRVGTTVGEKLWGLSAGLRAGNLRHQVLCVTHLPQLAAFGDVHFHVEKMAMGERTVTRVTSLKGKARVEELAQMLGGSGQAVHRSAEEILEEVTRRKRQGAKGGREK
jgi:DNA repair protein RecN (Recombination protein N)